MTYLYLDIGSGYTRISNGSQTIRTPTRFDVYYGRVFSVESRIVSSGKFGAPLRKIKSKQLPLMAHGTILEYDEMELFLIHLIRSLKNSSRPITAFAAAPAGITPPEKECLRNGLRNSGVRKVVFIDWLSALQSGLANELTSRKTFALIDLGHGTCDIALVTPDKTPEIKSIPMGGQDLCNAVETQLRTKHAAKGAPTLPLELRNRALSHPTSEPLEIGVRHLLTEEAEIIQLPLRETTEMLLNELAPLSSELAEMMQTQGCPEALVITGGLARLPEISAWLSNRFGIPVIRDNDPDHAIIRGLIQLHHAEDKSE